MAIEQSQTRQDAIQSFRLKLIGACSSSQQMRVREIRNQTSVRAAMYTDHEIEVSEHLDWLKKITSDPKQIVFVVLDEEDPIGVVSFNELDLLHKKADWAFYFDESRRGGLGKAIEYNVLEYAFNELGLEKLNCEVIEHNEAVVNLHKRFSFVNEGFRRENINKNSKRIGVHFLGLTKSDCLENKREIFTREKSTIQRFMIVIDRIGSNE